MPTAKKRSPVIMQPNFKQLVDRARFILLVSGISLASTTSGAEWKKLISSRVKELCDEADGYIPKGQEHKRKEFYNCLTEYLSTAFKDTLSNYTTEKQSHRNTIAFAGVWLMELAAR